MVREGLLNWARVITFIRMIALDRLAAEVRLSYLGLVGILLIGLFGCDKPVSSSSSQARSFYFAAHRCPESYGRYIFYDSSSSLEARLALLAVEACVDSRSTRQTVIPATPFAGFRDAVPGERTSSTPAGPVSTWERFGGGDFWVPGSSPRCVYSPSFDRSVNKQSWPYCHVKSTLREFRNARECTPHCQQQVDALVTGDSDLSTLCLKSSILVDYYSKSYHGLNNLRQELERFRDAPECIWFCSSQIDSLLKDSDLSLQEMCSRSRDLARVYTGVAREIEYESASIWERLLLRIKGLSWVNLFLIAFIVYAVINFVDWGSMLQFLLVLAIILATAYVIYMGCRWLILNVSSGAWIVTGSSIALVGGGVLYSQLSARQAGSAKLVFTLVPAIMLVLLLGDEGSVLIRVVAGVTAALGAIVGIGEALIARRNAD